MTKEEVQELISDRLWRLSLACADDHGAMKRLASIIQRVDFEGRHGCHRAHPHEDMSAECEAKTKKAQADAKARVGAGHGGAAPAPHGHPFRCKSMTNMSAHFPCPTDSCVCIDCGLTWKHIVETDVTPTDTGAGNPEFQKDVTIHWPAKPQLPSLILITAYNNGPLVELGTLAAREKVLLDYADAVKKTAHALVEATYEEYEKSPLTNGALRTAHERICNLEADLAEAQQELRGELIDRPAYEQASRQQGMHKAMEILVTRAEECQPYGDMHGELTLRRAWEAIREASENP